MKKRTLIMVGVGSFLLTSLTQLPASLLSKLLPADFPLRPEGVSGTLWQGAIARLNWLPMPMNNVRWELQPAALFKGQIAAHLQANPLTGGDIGATCGISITKKLDCQDVQINAMPIQVLTPYLQNFMLPPLSGNLQASLTHLQWAKPALPILEGNAQWQQAGLQMFPQRFGTYNATLAPGDNGAQQIMLGSAADASFTLSGNVTVQANGQYQSAINLKPTGTVDPGTVQFMNNAISPPQPDGSYVINGQGQLPVGQ